MAPPVEVYRKPRTVFVGGFVGNPPMNFLKLPVNAGEVRLGALTLTPPSRVNGSVVLGVRPEDLELSEGGFGFRVQVAEPLGPHILLTGEAEGQHMRVAIPPDRAVRAGETVMLRPKPAHIAWMDAESGLALEGE
jgi:multiple sugar transport system ATP-binding protein